MREIFMKQSVKYVDKLSFEIFVHKTLYWALYHVWFQNIVELYNANVGILQLVVFNQTEDGRVLYENHVIYDGLCNITRQVTVMSWFYFE